jgi:AcrR family transcriptional regulator
MARRSDHNRDELRRMALAAATKIMAKQGLRGLSTRRIAARMGYSPGTLYQLFEDLDDLILHVNATTLDGLTEACKDVDYSADPEAALQDLANRYIAYVGRNAELWNCVFEHRLPAGREAPPWFGERTQRLLGFGEKAIALLFGPHEEKLRQHEARVLWASLYGIAALATAKKLPNNESPQEMVRSLIRNFILGLQSTRTTVK